jgi:hypothetical protein
MTSPLTPQQLADVAREVTGHSELIEASETVFVQKSWRWDSNLWEPDFKGAEWQRSQALALVEWLDDKILSLDDIARCTSLLLCKAGLVVDKDTTALQRMVIELKGAGG